MSDVVSVRSPFQSVRSDGADGTKFQPSHQNADRIFSGGVNGEFVKRDSSSATGASWAAITKSDIGLANVENTALSTWIGSTSLTTLGTIGAGVWQGSVIAAAYLNLTSVVPATRAVNGHALTADITVTKSDVGLGNVENTALSTWAGSSSITIVGTLATLSVTATITGSVSGSSGSCTGNAATATLAATATSATVSLSCSGNSTTATLAASALACSGNAVTATALQTTRTINGVNFDGTGNITVTAAAGTLSGTTLASNVLASSLTSVGTLAALTVTATITGSVSGNAATATALQNARTINGTSFDGTGNITVTAAAGTLTGTTLAATVVTSSLTSVGTLATLTVTAAIVGSVTGSSASCSGNAATATLAGGLAGVAGSGTDAAGGDITVSGGVTTGTGAASRFLVKLPVVNAVSGSTPNALATRLVFSVVNSTSSRLSFRTEAGTDDIALEANPSSDILKVYTNVANNYGQIYAKAFYDANSDTFMCSSDFGGIVVGNTKGYMFGNLASAGGSTPDVALQRNAAGVIEVNSSVSGTFRDMKMRNLVVTGTVTNQVKAGTPTDSDVTTPADGQLIVDTTASKIWCRVGGAWKFAALL